MRFVRRFGALVAPDAYRKRNILLKFSAMQTSLNSAFAFSNSPMRAVGVKFLIRSYFRLLNSLGLPECEVFTNSG